MPLLSVIIPVYNEARTIKQILDQVKAVALDKEIIVVDDGSVDHTPVILKSLNDGTIKVIYHVCNRGKGAAFLTGLANASGDYVLIQDADLEYSPADYTRMVEAIQQDPGGLVLGARFSRSYHGLFWHRIGNRCLTALYNFLFGMSLNDYATCYNLAARGVFGKMYLSARGFDIDIEIVCKAAKQKLRFMELPVSYHPRSYREGKKIRWWDGLKAVYYMLKYFF